MTANGQASKPPLAFAPVAAPAEPTPATAATERVVLPEWMKEAEIWFTATERFATALAKEDATLTAELRQVRSVRKLVDAVLERVKPASGGAS